MRSLYKIIAEENEKSKEYFKNYLACAKEIKKVVKKFWVDARVLVFGSAVKRDNRLDSDIDILIISSFAPEGLFEQAKIKIKIKEKFPDGPFEIHLITPEEYENWYKGFIKGDYIEV